MKVCGPTENGERNCRRIAILPYIQKYKKDEVRTMVDSCELVSEPRLMNDPNIYECIERKTEKLGTAGPSSFLMLCILKIRYKGWLRAGENRPKSCPSPL